jgi:hypothetical protein
MPIQVVQRYILYQAFEKLHLQKRRSDAMTLAEATCCALHKLLR